MPEQTDIQKLLRLKRFEQPSEVYFENFLEEFQRRQRAEILRRSLWEIVCDRAGAFFGQFSVPQYAYGAASAAVLMVAGVLSFGILSSDPASSTQFAADTTNSAVGRVQPAAAALVYTPDAFGSEQPHYVIDARPVSYEAPFSF